MSDMTIIIIFLFLIVNKNYEKYLVKSISLYKNILYN